MIYTYTHDFKEPVIFHSAYLEGAQIISEGTINPGSSEEDQKTAKTLKMDYEIKRPEIAKSKQSIELVINNGDFGVNTAT